MLGAASNLRAATGAKFATITRSAPLAVAFSVSAPPVTASVSSPANSEAMMVVAGELRWSTSSPCLA